MQTKRKTPMRMCVGCSEMKPKTELVRIVKKSLEDGGVEISVDTVGKKPGRGAYICKDTQCLAKARKTKRLERTFECRIADEVYDELEREMCVDG